MCLQIYSSCEKLEAYVVTSYGGGWKNDAFEFSLVQDGVYALGNAHMSSTPSLKVSPTYAV